MKSNLKHRNQFRGIRGDSCKIKCPVFNPSQLAISGANYVTCPVFTPAICRTMGKCETLIFNKCASF